MIDRSKKLSTINPTDEWGGAYLQEGRVYNNQEVFLPKHPDNEGKKALGQKVAAKIVASVKTQELIDTPPTVVELMELMGKVKFLAWRHECRKLLGKDTPKAKADILMALKELGVVEDKSKPVEPKGIQWDQFSEEEVNLTAWASGEADYIMPDVYSAIQARYHKAVTNKRDAIDFLVDEGVIQPEQARQY